MGISRRPSESDVQNNNAFASYVYSGITAESDGKPLRTSASVSGIPQYAASSMSVSDILQGSFDVKDPNDQMLVVNKALTQDLSGLYNLGADSVSSFSTTPASSLLANGAGANGAVNGGSAESGGGGILNETWVSQLPTVHPTTKALIWMPKGKASSEMHLPTSGDLASDIQQHKQYPDLAPNQKHPWYMDRVGGGVGGETSELRTVSANTTALNEDPSKPGKPGAFGFLDPDSEQFYCSMAWPYAGGAESSFNDAQRSDISKIASGLKQSAYKDKRVLVYSTTTKMGCVCTPGDWGPLPKWSNGTATRASINGFCIGLSQDVHHALHTEHGETVMIGWVPDNTPLGPYTPKSAAEGTANNSAPVAVGGGVGGGSSGSFTDATGRDETNSFDQIKYAGQMIARHKNARVNSSALASFTSGFGVDSSASSKVPVYDRATSHGYYMPSLLNYLWYILEGGFLLEFQYGGYVNRNIVGGTTLSNHAKGGAIDIMRLGRASDSQLIAYNTPQWRPLMDQIFGYLDQNLPKGTRPEELGCTFKYDYPNGLHIYKDPNPTHLHIGFNESQVGSLIPALLPKSLPNYPVVNGTVN